MTQICFIALFRPGTARKVKKTAIQSAGAMAELVSADGAILEEILDATHEIWHDSLGRAAYGRLFTAQLLTPWGQRHLRRLALVDGPELLASAKLYSFDASLDSRPIRVAGIGAVFTQPAHRGRGAARDLIERLLARSAASGADLALLFSEIGPDYYARLGFAAVPTSDRHLLVTEPMRYGAPATMVRSGDDRDLPDIVAMGQARAAPFRFHLNRDRDLVHFSIARKRLLAGLGAPGARQVQFFIAEEGASAAAYVVINARDGVWTLEECGDRDPTGARVGAILQVLIARDPAERRPTITGWLPAGFLPPQVSSVAEGPSAEVMMLRPLSSVGDGARGLSESDVLFWRGDMF
jgi:GNAT superfamily N-acetyltransferase